MEDISVLFIITAIIFGFGLVTLFGIIFSRGDEDER
jgi:Ni/Fe-hydrogenase subunit HybB-like protein